MIGALSVFLLISSVFAGQCDIRYSTFEPAEGNNVTLHGCIHPPMNLEMYTLDCKRVDDNFTDSNRVVFSRRHGKDHPHPQTQQYRNRTFLVHDDLRKGFLTLIIISVGLSDSGEYKCSIPKLKTSFIFTVAVKNSKAIETKREDFSTTSPSVEDRTNSDSATKKRSRLWLFSIFIPVCVLVAVLLIFRNKKPRRQEGHETGTERQKLEGMNEVHPAGGAVMVAGLDVTSNNME